MEKKSTFWKNPERILKESLKNPDPAIKASNQDRPYQKWNPPHFLWPIDYWKTFRNCADFANCRVRITFRRRRRKPRGRWMRSRKRRRGHSAGIVVDLWEMLTRGAAQFIAGSMGLKPPVHSSAFSSSSACGCAGRGRGGGGGGGGGGGRRPISCRPNEIIPHLQ